MSRRRRDPDRDRSIRDRMSYNDKLMREIVLQIRQYDLEEIALKVRDWKKKMGKLDKPRDPALHLLDDE